MNKEKKVSEWLDERWVIVTEIDSNTADVAFYQGAIKAIEMLGHEWKRDEKGI